MRFVLPAAAAALAFAAPAWAAPVNVPAVQSTIKYSTTATGASLYGNYARATSKVVYDSAAGTYVVRDTGSLSTTATFGPSNLVSSSGNFSTYGTATNSFRRLNLSPSNTLIALTYVDYGQWRRTSTTVARVMRVTIASTRYANTAAGRMRCRMPSLSAIQFRVTAASTKAKPVTARTGEATPTKSLNCAPAGSQLSTP